MAFENLHSAAMPARRGCRGSFCTQYKAQGSVCQAQTIVCLNFFSRCGKPLDNALWPRYNSGVHESHAEVVKWYTRYVQVVVLARACEFESRLRHPDSKLNFLTLNDDS